MRSSTGIIWTLEARYTLTFFDDRMEIFSPGGMYDGSLVQELDTDHVPSRRRNPIIADIFSRMNYMERRGSGFKKIKEDYHTAVNYRPEVEPKFYSTATSFWVTLYNLNYNVPVGQTGFSDGKQVFGASETGFSDGKQVFEGEKPDSAAMTRASLLEEKLNELQFKDITKEKIRVLYQRFGSELTFSRTDVMEVTGISLSPAGDLIRKMKEADLIEKVYGHERGLYWFKI